MLHLREPHASHCFCLFLFKVTWHIMTWNLRRWLIVLKFAGKKNEKKESKSQNSQKIKTIFSPLFSTRKGDNEWHTTLLDGASNPTARHVKKVVKFTLHLWFFFFTILPRIWNCGSLPVPDSTTYRDKGARCGIFAAPTSIPKSQLILTAFKTATTTWLIKHLKIWRILVLWRLSSYLISAEPCKHKVKTAFT